MENETMLKEYLGTVPSCGVFCGGCPNYVRSNNPCPGASNCDRCDGCKSYHLCCVDKGIRHCYECGEYPCRRFKDFANRWKKYGQDFIENQRLLKEVGEAEFIQLWNAKAIGVSTIPHIE